MRIVKNGDVHVSVPIGMPKKEVERCLQCQGQVHLLLCLSAAVAGMVCRARGGSRTVPSVGTQPQCPIPCVDGQVLPSLEGSQKRDKADM